MLECVSYKTFVARFPDVSSDEHLIGKDFSVAVLLLGSIF
jgi:hypothetical protein